MSITNIIRLAQRFLALYSVTGLHAILICSILYGLICKFFIAINSNLNSDYVSAGIISMEIWRHKNYLLDGYYLPSADPYIFSDILPFHFVPQVISDFNPLYLKIMSYVIYILIVVIFSYIAFKITGKFTNALLFASLMANISTSYWFSFMGSSHYLFPTTHNATVLFTGYFILAFLRINPVSVEYKTDIRAIISLFFLLLIVFSDVIILLWFVIPVTIYYFRFYENKCFSNTLLILFMNILSSIIYVLTPYIVEQFLPLQRKVRAEDISIIITENIPMFVRGMSQELCLNFSPWELLNFYNMSAEFMLLEIVYIISFLVVTYFIVRSAICGNNSKSVNYMYIYMLISATMIFLAYICVTLFIYEFNSRYLMFTGLSIFMLIAITYNNKSLNDKMNNLYLGSVLFILSYMILLNHVYIPNMDVYSNSNKDEYELINYLEENNLTYGLGDYWDSNLITYLSNERVIIRSAIIHNGEIFPLRWMASENWFNNSSSNTDTYFIISKDNNVFLKQEEIEKMLKVTNYSRLLHIKKYKNYLIYVFDGPIPYEQFIVERIYEAEELNSLSGQIIQDINASGGFCRFAASNESGVIVFGPYVKIPNGTYIASFKIKTGNCTSSQPLVRVDVSASAGSEIITEKEISCDDFENLGTYQIFDVLFESSGQNNFEFRVFKYPNENLWVDQITIRVWPIPEPLI